MTELLLRDERDGLCTLTLNRPEALNALSPSLFVELRAHIDDLSRRSEEIGAVILCGAGRSFSAGNDLKAIQAGDTAPSRHFQAETIDALEALPQPVIGAIHGHCYTGSLELALGCDILLAAESARFADNHGKWGMSPIWGMSQRLPRRVGVQRAKEMMFSGRVVSGREAQEIGLVLECLPDEALLSRAEAMARTFLANAWFTLRADKMLVNQGLDHVGQAGLQFERVNNPGRSPDLEQRLAQFGKG